MTRRLYALAAAVAAAGALLGAVAKLAEALHEVTHHLDDEPTSARPQEVPADA